MCRLSHVMELVLFDQLGFGEDRFQPVPFSLDIFAAAFFTVDQGDDAENIKPLFLGPVDRFHGGTAGGDDILDNDHFSPLGQILAPLQPLAGAGVGIIERGLRLQVEDQHRSFAALDGDSVMGVAYSQLVCSRGIEVSIFVEEKYRKRGVATALGSRLLLECLRQNIRPNWDAANPESCKLAQKLGLAFMETYEAYYVAGT